MSLTYSGISDQDEPTMEDSSAPGNNYRVSALLVAQKFSFLCYVEYRIFFDILEHNGPDLLILLNTFLAPDFENEIKKETKAAPKTDSKASIEEPQGASLGRITKGLCQNKSNAQTLYCNCFIFSLSGSKSELKALIEKEVREQMTLVSGQLDQRMKDIADQHNSAQDSPQPNHKAKK